MNYTLRIPNRINVFIILTLIVFLTPVITQMAGSNYFKLIEDLAYLVLLTHSIYIMILNNKIVIGKSIVMPVFILLLVLFSLIGIYYNGISLVILQYREFKYLLLLIIMIPYSDKEYFKNVWTALKIIAAISVPVAVIQWIIYRDDGDRITGLLGYGGSGTLTLFVLIVFFTELGMRLQYNKPVLGYYFLYLIPTFINETKITFVLIPVMLMSTLIITKKLNSKKAILIIILCLLVVVIYAVIYERVYSKSIFEIFSYDYLSEYLFATNWIGDAGRLAKVLFAYNIIKNGNFFLGYGLGSSYIGATSGKVGYIARNFYNESMFGGTRPQLFLSLLDMGVLGTALLLIIIIFFFIKVLKNKVNTIERFIAINGFIILFVTLLYQNIFYTYQIMYIIILYTTLHLKNQPEVIAK